MIRWKTLCGALALMFVVQTLPFSPAQATGWSRGHDPQLPPGLVRLQEKFQALKKELRSGRNAVHLGPRPFWLVDDMAEGPLKERLQACQGKPMRRTDFSIGHRGAPMQFPEHTMESYVAAARMGAGILECDVAFTKDRQLVCRHAQDDLHTTTNIVAIPELNARCTQPFVPADPANGIQARAECRTSDITLEEFKSLEGKMDAFNPMATTPEAYLGGTAGWRTDLYASRGTLAQPSGEH